MKRLLVLKLAFTILTALALLSGKATFAEEKVEAKKEKKVLRIVCFGAHPDDSEYKDGGAAALWAKNGTQSIARFCDQR